MDVAPVQTDREKEPEAVVGQVPEAVPDALDLLDEHVHRLGRAVAGWASSGGVERGQELALPGI